MQMCEQAAEAHKSKGVVHSSGRSRTNSDSGQMTKSSVDALLSNSSSAPFSQVYTCLSHHILSFALVDRLRNFPS